MSPEVTSNDNTQGPQNVMSSSGFPFWVYGVAAVLAAYLVMQLPAVIYFYSVS